MSDPLVERFTALLREPSLPNYYQFAASFIPTAAAIGVKGRNPWQEYVLNLILNDENLFSSQAESRKFSRIPGKIRALAAQDLRLLQALASLTGRQVRALLAGQAPESQLAVLPDWEGLYLEGKADKAKIKGIFQNMEDWSDGLKALAGYYQENGVGLFGQYHAFRWVKKGDNEGSLVGVKNLDTIQLQHLYEYEAEQAKVLQNTEQFLLGYPANNVLLYGDRGTGKSSTVKALVNKYWKRGLRLVEVQKQDLVDFPVIISQLAGRSQQFILFIDDLSFNEQESQYRELKALLEGGLEARPRNVLVYATSNRRHLVQESFADREITGIDPDLEDVRYMDTLEEKLSLADRFGITVTFTSPDKKRYLAIVEKLAADRDLQVDKDELHQRALKWEMSFNSRSARTAKQFIDFMEGQLALDKEKAR